MELVPIRAYGECEPVRGCFSPQQNLRFAWGPRLWAPIEVVYENGAKKAVTSAKESKGKLVHDYQGVARPLDGPAIA